MELVAIVLILFLAVVVYSVKKENKSKTETVIPEKTGLNAPPDIEKRPLVFSHFNPSAWHDKGIAMVLCLDSPEMEWMHITDRDGNSFQMVKHGRKDKGRDVWKRLDRKCTAGRIRASDGRIVYHAVVHGNSVNRGACWGVKDDS